jgi:anti-anti-sigma regulatory factor
VKTAISLDSSAQPWVLRLEGSLRSASAAELLRVAREAAAGNCEIAVECGAVTDLDAAALQVLVALSLALGRSHRRLLLRSPSAPLLDAITLAALKDEFALEAGR